MSEGGGGGGVQPLHALVRPIQDNLKFELPPSNSGYVTPGFIVMR